MKRVNFRLFALAIALVATSCIKDVVVDSNFHGTPSEKICFGAELKDTGEDTRAASRNRVGKHDLKSADGEFVLPMGVYVEDGIRSANGDAAETRGALFTDAGVINEFTVWAKHKVDENVSGYFNGVVYEKNTTDNVFYSTGDEYMWPGVGELTFVAVTNAPESGFVPNYTAGSDGNDMLESFTYTVPADATAQNDIVLAKATYIGGYDASAPLTFSHIMSAVNVQIGAVSAGTIESITFKGVYNKGSYNVDTNKWTVDTSSTADYSVMFAGGGDSFTTTGSQANGTPINADNATFMFIPQEPGAGAVMEIVFNNGDRTETLTGKIEGDIWDKGKTVNYKLSIDKDFTLKVEPNPTAKKLDAHFIITDVFVTVAGNISNWKIKASADDGVKVTIIPYDEANPLAQRGYWTDVEVDETGKETTTSARGESEYKGSGSIDEKRFLVFIPENISDKDRQISITLSSTDTGSTASSTKILLQKYPNWTGNIGWEVVDDDEAGKYGFKWTRKVAYVYPYWRLLQYTARSQCQAYIDQYNAGANGFATVGTYRKSIVQHRGYIWLDYTVLNSVEGADSSTDGFNNTLELYRQAGNTATSEFETILDATKKSESGHEHEDLFRVANAGDISDGAPAEQGNDNDLSAIMEYIQKKNRYCLQKHSIDSGDSDGSGTTYVPYFQEKDLKWFLPAYGQFSGVDFTPENTTDTAADYWSSTTAGPSTAYIGSGAEKDRDAEFAVIAVRVNEGGYKQSATIDEINVEEMAGGENGEAQWVE